MRSLKHWTTRRTSIVLALSRAKGWLTTAEVAECVGARPEPTATSLRWLEEGGIIRCRPNPRRFGKAGETGYEWALR